MVKKPGHSPIVGTFIKTKNAALWKTLLLLMVSSYILFTLFQKDGKLYGENYILQNNTKTTSILKVSEWVNKTKNQSTPEVIKKDERNLHIGSGSAELLKKDFNAALKCPILPPHLKGRQNITFESIPSLMEMEKNYTNLLRGGRYSPSECQARQRVAIIIPYRDRKKHLITLLYYLHPFLQRQQIEYGIYVVEQAGKAPFNRGMLLNVGFLETSKLHPYHCFIFHDVDLIPEDDRNLYLCLRQPRHGSVAVSTLKYRLPYATIFGGVVALTADHIRKVNGFSNLFWGWGGEDDDMSWRVTSHGFKILRYHPSIARYKMMSHRKDKPNPKRKKLLKQKKNLSKNGISTIRYNVVNVQQKPLYTLIQVNLKR